MYICCNIYTHPKRKPKQFIYKNHSMRIDTDMRMRQEGYKLTQRIVIDPSQKNYKKALKYRQSADYLFIYAKIRRAAHICERREFE